MIAGFQAQFIGGALINNGEVRRHIGFNGKAPEQALAEGMDGSYSSSLAVFSMEDKATNIANRGYSVKQFQMNLTKKESFKF